MFGIEVIEASLALSMCIALAAGVISFLSPCVLPIVPPYLAYMAGSSSTVLSESSGPDRRVVTAAIFFVLGLSTVFMILGSAASLVGQTFVVYQQYFTWFGGIIILIFGFHFLGLVRIPFLFREARFDVGDKGGTPFGAYLLGLAFAFGWTPCIGPVLGSILFLAADSASVAKGMLLLAVYAAGLGIPFLLAAIFLNRFIGMMQSMRKHMATVERVMGVLLVGVGVLLLTGGFADISFWLLETFPSLGAIG